MLKIILLFSFVLSGCSSLLHYHDPVSIDSNPRGLDLYVNDKKEGKTPQFVSENDLGRSYVLDLKNENKECYHGSYQCRTNFASGIVGNGALSLPLFFISPPLGMLAMMAFVSTDYYSNNIWDCENNIKISIENIKAPKRPCRTYIVFPPKEIDEDLADAGVRIWKRSFLYKMGECDEFADDYKVHEAFLKFDIKSYRNNTIEDLPALYMRKIGYETGATDAVFLGLKSDNRIFNITSQTRDLHTGEIEDGIAVKAVYKENKEKEHSEFENLNQFKKRFFRMMRFVPNSFFVAPISLDYFTGSKPYHTLEEGTSSKYLSYFTRFSVLTLRPRESTRLWNVDVQIAPIINSNFIHKKIRVQYTKSSSADADVNYNSVYGAFELSLLTYGPIGRLALSVGAGPYWSSRRKIGFGYHYGVSHIGFVTERAFTRISLNYIDYNQTLYKASSGDRATGIVSLSFGLGYYLPEIYQLITDNVISRAENYILIPIKSLSSDKKP